MKHFRPLMLTTVLMLACAAQVVGQTHELRIPKPVLAPVYINDYIVGDTLAGGVRQDSSRIYVLERGGLYFQDVQIRNTGWKLTIKAQDSAGTRPVVYLVKGRTNGTQPGSMYDVRGNILFKNLVLDAILEADTTYFSVMNGSIMNTGAAGAEIVIDSCILTNTSGNHIRTDNAARAIKVTNSIFGNMGYLGRSNLGAGKAIDLRAGSCDTVYLVNNTFVNGQDRILRHFQSTAAINVLIFDHNTVVNNMSYHGLLSLGRMGRTGRITNNLLVDAFALGNDTDYVRQGEFNESGELDQYGLRRMSWIFSVNNDSTQWNIRNNFYAVTDSGTAFFTRYSLSEGAPLSWHINSRIGVDSATTFTKLPGTFTLTAKPRLMTKMMDWYRVPLAQGGGGKSKVTTNFNRLLYDYDRRTWQYFDDTLNCAYSTGSAAYTGGLNGYPAGDLNWFPSQKTAWMNDPATSVYEPEALPESFTLDQNYPNPFNPATRITFTVPFESRVKLEVFDILGRSVATLVDGPMQYGVHHADFDASRIGSGTYFYRLSAGTQVITKKMLFLK